MGLIDKVVKKEIRDLKRIKDTFDDRFDYLRMDKNERIVPFHDQQLEHFRSSIGSSDLSGYAEIEHIYRKLASYLGVETSQILLASGSDLAIKSVYEACVERGNNVVLHMPSYAMYRVYAWMFGAEVRPAPIKKDWSVDIGNMLGNINDDTKLMVLEHPNGFVGTKPDYSHIEYCACELNKKNVILLIDEAYYFIENSRCASIDLISKCPNVIISQTFSKCHGLAGTRFGYLIGHPDLMLHISKVKPMHEISSLTALAVDWILKHPEILEEYRRVVNESKKAMMAGFENMKIKCKNTHGNFIMAYFPDEGVTKNMAQKLKDRKILIRRPFEEEYLRGWCRVTVGSLNDTNIFINAVKEVISSVG